MSVDGRTTIAAIEEETVKALRQLTGVTWGVVLLGGLLSAVAGVDWAARVRHFGGVLQLAGVVAVAGEVYLLQHPGESIGVVTGRVWRRLVGWLRRVLGLPRSVTIHAAGGTTSGVGVVDSVEGLRRSAAWNRPPSDDLHEGLERLEEMVRDLDRLLGEERKRRAEDDRAEAEARAEAIDALRDELNEAISNVEHRLTEAARRPIRLRWTGVVLLILGIIFAAWPGAIAQASGAVLNGLAALPVWVWAVVLVVVVFVKLRLEHTR